MMTCMDIAVNTSSTPAFTKYFVPIRNNYALSIPISFRCQEHLFQNRRGLSLLGRYSFLTRSQDRRLFLSCSVNVPTAEPFGEPDKLKTQVNNLRGRLWEIFPQQAKEFPWKKAEDVVLHCGLSLGQKTLKWSLITLFILSFISDMIFSIRMDRELIVPIGLFIGCTVANFLKDVSQEFLKNSKERRWVWQFAGISSFFILVKFLSVCLAIQGRVFLSHVCNGGLMQVLWFGKKLTDAKNAEVNSSAADN